MKKKDLVLIGVLLLVALGAWLGIQRWQAGRVAVVTKPAAGQEETTVPEPEAEPTTEAVTESVTEAASEASSEAVTEAGTEAQTGQAEAAANAALYGIRIYAAGEELGVYSLAEDQVIDIGGTNTVEIKDGGATMIDAQCPDQLCRYMGTITDAYGLIVCLPNGVIVEGVNLAPQPEEPVIDGIS